MCWIRVVPSPVTVAATLPAMTLAKILSALFAAVLLLAACRETNNESELFVPPQTDSIVSDRCLQKGSYCLAAGQDRLIAHNDGITVVRSGNSNNFAWDEIGVSVYIAGAIYTGVLALNVTWDGGNWEHYANTLYSNMKHAVKTAVFIEAKWRQHNTYPTNEAARNANPGDTASTSAQTERL